MNYKCPCRDLATIFFGKLDTNTTSQKGLRKYLTQREIWKGGVDQCPCRDLATFFFGKLDTNTTSQKRLRKYFDLEKFERKGKKTIRKEHEVEFQTTDLDFAQGRALGFMIKAEVSSLSDQLRSGSVAGGVYGFCGSKTVDQQVKYDENNPVSSQNEFTISLQANDVPVWLLRSNRRRSSSRSAT